MRSHAKVVVLLLVSLVFIIGGCAKQHVSGVDRGEGPLAKAGQEAAKPAADDSAGMVQEDISSRTMKEVPAEEVKEQAVFKDIHFDFDKSDVKPEDVATLDSIANWMLANRASTLVIEGHCDERGSNEYNLALGERRAKAAEGYLVAQGVSADRLTTISYGEERPVDPGHSEDAWAQNRRAHFLVR